MNYAIFVEGIESLKDFETLKEDIRIAASRAINKVVRDSRVAIRRRIQEEVNLPAAYLSDTAKRLYVSRFAKPGTLEARIAARSRATSLAQFAQTNGSRGAGVSLEVKPGHHTTIRRAFLLPLMAGKEGTDTKRNLGLAVRLRPGESLQNKRKMIRVARNLYLLYGPSVNQVFLSEDGGGVAKDMSPKIQRDLEREFVRLMEL